MVGIYHYTYVPTYNMGPTRHLYILLVLANPLIYYFVGHGEQFNGITAFVDASNVYTSNESDSLKLRNSGGSVSGSLKVTKRKDGNLLPKIGKNDPDFRAGDMRAREMPGLLSIHTIWMREHNRIGKKRKLKKIHATIFMSLIL